jgi:predicted MPP superfamily phosphohydrolase
MKSKFSLTNILWDAWCFSSIIGIWPRFIEPKLIRCRRHELKIPSLPEDLQGIRILQFTDLHLGSQTKPKFLKKLQRKITELSPDMIVYTGDFICHSKLENFQDTLHAFLKPLKAPLGCYACFGNHDYSQYLGINDEGEYDISNNSSTTISHGFSRLFKSKTLKKHVTERAKAIPLHNELCNLLEDSPFQVLHNKCVQVPYKNSGLNVCGLGDYFAGRCLPEEAFANYDSKLNGIILSHNPDSISLLKNYPGDIILSGHSHGGQVNLPWMWKRFTLLEQQELRYGLHSIENKRIHVSCGLGSPLTFRWFARPEICLFTLKT